MLLASFSAAVLDQSSHQETRVPFIEKWSLKAKIWVLVMLISENNTFAHTHTRLYLHLLKAMIRPAPQARFIFVSPFLYL